MYVLYVLCTLVLGMITIGIEIVILVATFYIHKLLPAAQTVLCEDSTASIFVIRCAILSHTVSSSVSRWSVSKVACRFETDMPPAGDR